MSLILDALNKSDREAKDYSGAPSIDANHGLPYLSRDNTKTFLLGAIALLILIAVVLLATIALKKPSIEPATPTNTVTTQTTLPNNPSHAQPSLNSPSQNTLIKAGAATASPSDIKSAEANAPTKEIAPSAVAALYATESTEQEIVIKEHTVNTANSQQATDEKQALAQLLWDKSEIKKLTRREQVSPPQAEVVEPVKEVENSILKVADVAFVHNLSVAIQNTIPTLMYSEHSYADGYAIINQKKVLVGDLAATEVTLEELREDGAIFSMGDLRFKLSSQSSWVNY